MPGSATSYLQQRVLGHTLGFAAYTMPTTIYVGLCTSLPSAITGGLEIAISGYARRTSAFALVGGRIDLANNTATMEWAPATAPWGSVGWFELWDAATAGSRLYWGPLVDPTDGVTPVQRFINTGDIMRLPAGNVTVQAI